MVVSFDTQELRDFCESLELAVATIGSAHAQELRTVLSDAEAAETAAEFIEFYSPFVSVADDSISLPIGTKYRASFVALSAGLDDDCGTGIEWSEVRRLKMMDLSKC